MDILGSEFQAFIEVPYTLYLEDELDTVASVLSARRAAREVSGVKHALHVMLDLLQSVREIGLHAQRLLRDLPQLALHPPHFNLQGRIPIQMHDIRMCLSLCVALFSRHSNNNRLTVPGLQME